MPRVGLPKEDPVPETCAVAIEILELVECPGDAQFHVPQRAETELILGVLVGEFLADGQRLQVVVERLAAMIELPVRLVEPLGKDTLLYFDASNERAFVAVTEGLGMADVKVGERVALSLDQRLTYLFDAEGRRINTA